MTTKKPKSNKPSNDLPEIEESEIKIAETVDGDKKPVISPKKVTKVKLIRDSFTFPEQDYQKISDIKKTCLAEGMHVKKSEVLRAGLHLLTNLSLTELKQVVDQVEKLPTGRPKSS